MRTRSPWRTPRKMLLLLPSMNPSLSPRTIRFRFACRLYKLWVLFLKTLEIQVTLINPKGFSIENSEQQKKDELISNEIDKASGSEVTFLELPKPPKPGVHLSSSTNAIEWTESINGNSESSLVVKYELVYPPDKEVEFGEVHIWEAHLNTTFDMIK